MDLEEKVESRVGVSLVGLTLLLAFLPVLWEK
jgi:hypothetical protein